MKQVVHHGWNAFRALGRAMLLAGLAWVCSAGALAAPPALLAQKCGTCHQEKEGLQRIFNIRKSPEGWDMTIVRMTIWHKLEISRAERKVLVKYLADTQGLAPQESAPYRALIERRPNVGEVAPSEELTQMCARCHSFGRVALQRRDTEEWRKLVHTHMGQFPSIEYSAQGRDRNWFDLAVGEVATKLGELYPYSTKEWKTWQAARHRPPTGNWRIAGHQPGVGAYAGTMQVRALGQDRYAARYDLLYDSGDRISGEGDAVVYAGYEWRGSASLGNRETRSIFNISADGKTMSGRWFMRRADEIGARFEAVRADAARPGTLIAVSPALLKAGESTTLRVSGIKLGASFDLGPDVRVEQATRVSDDEVQLTVRVAEAAAAGWRNLGPGANGEPVKFAIYRKIDAVRVEPPFAFARLGGGTNAPVTAQFEAIAYLNGADGKPDTEDDVRLGPVRATWSVDNQDDKAKALNDVAYAGVMEPTGRFLPAAAGPNPVRNNLSNVGDLAVLATVKDGAQAVTGKGRLVVAAQRWNTPPLR
jgi:quinohemoprotein amine dehydrogenase